MKSFYKYLLPVVLLVSLSSCSVTRYRSYSMNDTRLNVSMDDLVYIGETEISADYRKYIGFISALDSLNGEVYDRAQRKTVEVGNVPEGLYRYLNRAAYKLVEEFPEADYFIVVSQNKSITRLFLGSDISVKARIKAYKFNNRTVE
ncbi:MAG TPA: hypothetical protein IAC04_04300 [Candidatus Coprenecus stercoravium]|uniref:Lipoprotein n=1 Tax=Candidatus Coprenecus stercoravium TaxID=2840735 RepID=A0A9D2GQG1_9BACT|nr:hypothetical protein [Candidatus Coprenecus stercoravium]